MGRDPQKAWGIIGATFFHLGPKSPFWISWTSTILLADFKFCLHFKNHTELQQNVSLLSTVSYILQKKRKTLKKQFKPPPPKIGQFQKESLLNVGLDSPTARPSPAPCAADGLEADPRPVGPSPAAAASPAPRASSKQQQGGQQLPRVAQEAACWEECLQLPLPAVSSS